jgi:hypothetical protein
MRGYPGIQSELKKVPLYKEEARLQSIRDAVRELVTELPRGEATVHLLALNHVEASIARKKDIAAAKSKFDWAKVPNEVKNMIYGYLMVQEDAIQPFVSHAADKQRRSPRKYALGGNFLLTCKAVYQEALPILLGANTFEVNGHLLSFLGATPKSRNERAKLVRHIIISAQTTWTEAGILKKLTNVTNCIVVSDPVRFNTAAHKGHSLWRPGDLSINSSRTELERVAKEGFKNCNWAAHRFVKENPDAKFHYLHEFRLKPRTYHFGLRGDRDIVAVRHQVKHEGQGDRGQDLFKLTGGYKIEFYPVGEERNMPLV